MNTSSERIAKKASSPTGIHPRPIARTVATMTGTTAATTEVTNRRTAHLVGGPAGPSGRARAAAVPRGEGRLGRCRLGWWPGAPGEPARPEPRGRSPVCHPTGGEPPGPAAPRDGDAVLAGRASAGGTHRVGRPERPRQLELGYRARGQARLGHGTRIRVAHARASRRYRSTVRWWRASWFIKQSTQHDEAQTASARPGPRVSEC